MKKKIKWGIIGCGNIAYNFANAFREVDNAEFIAIASKSKEKLDRFGKKFNIKKEFFFNNYDEIIENNKIDIFYIALTNNLHSQVIAKLIEKKKNILVEKPAFMSVKEAEIIFNMKNFKNIFFTEGYMFRYHPQIVQIKKIIESGEIGKIIKMESNFGFNLIYKKNIFGFKKMKIDKNKRIFNKNLGGGAILDLGCYTTSMSLLIASFINEINISNFKVENICTEYSKSEVDIHSSALINFDNKFYSKISASFSKEIGTKTIISGELGQVILEQSWNSNNTELKILNKENKLYTYKNIRNLYSLEIENISNDIYKKKVEATFPGISKNNILLNSKIIDHWINV